jgi:hypothetical protein
MSRYIEAGYTVALASLAGYGAILLTRERRAVARLRASGALPPRRTRRSTQLKARKPEDVGD